MRPIVTLGLAAALLLAGGCSRSSTVVHTTPNGAETVTVSNDGKQIRVNGPDGTSRVESGGNVDLEKVFGLAPYPGAAQKVAAESQSGDETTNVATLTTPDAHDKVVAWYKERLPKAQFVDMDANGVKTASLSIEEGNRTLSVTIMRDGSETTINLVGTREANTRGGSAASPSAGAHASSVK